MGWFWRKSKQKEVIERNNITNLKETILKDIINLRKEYKSTAIITKTIEETEYIYSLLKDNLEINKISTETEEYNRKLIIIPAYLSKGLEFDSVIIYTNKNNKFNKEEKYLFYVACTRCQHQLIVYNQK